MNSQMIHIRLQKDLMNAVSAEAKRQSAAGLRRVTRTEIVRLCVASALGLQPVATLDATVLADTGGQP
jgi:hypothetical protein